MFVRWCLFLAHRRWSAVALITLLALPAVFWAGQTSFSAKLSDYYPLQHPHVKLYQEFTEMLRMTNTVIITVTVRDGTIFTSDTLGKVHRLTVGLLDTRGVNPFEVMSLTHPRLKNINVRSEGINILPIVEHPEQPHSPDELAHIKKAVYTNLGIRGVYVSSDEKSALIRAGFWDGMAEPRAVLARLQTLAAQERDANTDITFAGNLVLAAWLIETAPRFLFLMIVSAGVAVLSTSLFSGALSSAILVLLVNLFGALWGFSLLRLQGLALQPLAIIAFFPLSIRGVALVMLWHARLVDAYAAVASPFAGEANREQALTHTAALLGRPFTVALVVDALVFFALTRLDVPALQALGYVSMGWSVGLLVSLWTMLPLWAALLASPRLQAATAAAWGAQLTERVASFVRAVLRPSALVYGAIALSGICGALAATQLQAGRKMLGTTLFYASHPFNRAFSLVNNKFIGMNQFIVIAQAPSEAAFRDPKALEALEAFQHHMAADAQFGGSMAITGLAKSLTRMFHEDVPKWEIIPDDIDSTGQVIFRIISSAATPSEVERFLSTDYHTTAVSLFYRDYSPKIVERVLTRAREFIAQKQNGAVEFRIGGGIFGVLAAVHASVERAYWRTIGVLLLLTALGGLVSGKSLRSLLSALAAVLLTQAILLSILWFGGVDFNMYTLPVIVVSAGALLLPIFLASARGAEERTPLSGCAAASLIAIAAASVWLFSPLRLQAEMGVFFIGLAVIMTVIPFGLQRSYSQE
ncbi:MAG TPA: hypothetical protein VNN62_19160 [Methylomirabilota bacterium]|nr:hypothetical protein [Methylomirabilota bacterium]